MQKKKTVVLGVTGSIAAYKAADIVSRLRKHNISVYTIMTQSAMQLLQPLTLETLSGHPVASDLFQRETPWEIEHISLAKRADLFLVAPASANFIGKYANGIADDLLTTTAMAMRCPVLVAPAMNTAMYESDANQANMDVLRSRNCHFIEPDSGWLACGDNGKGRLASVENIVMEALMLLHPWSLDMKGLNVLVSAGPTQEMIDPVRYISNRSSGKMGFAIAQAAARRGANVTLVSGPTNLKALYSVKQIDVQTTQEMCGCMNDAFDDCDICIMAAAPADYAPLTYENQKIKKNRIARLNLQLTKTVDIISQLSERKESRFICGFAAETEDVESYAKGKLEKKGLDMIAANDVSKKEIGFDSEENALMLFFANGDTKELKQAPKSEIALMLLDQIMERYHVESPKLELLEDLSNNPVNED